MTRLPAAIPNRVVEAFWGKVVKSPSPDGCWIFTGAISSPDGYGRINFRVDGRQYSVSAHRFALMLSGTDISDSEVVADHRCNEPLCVRIDSRHVIASTREANARYASLTGRARGQRPGLDTQNRSRVQRSRDVRAAVVDGWDEKAYALAARRPVNPLEQPPLF
ncbi:hypothetical protein FRC0290_00621 [Corynebacterium diphtheriae]|uniref:hypothetical protein n=1 Tax=Corynebacterium diphtheriae TaxID=1717 RepID=UPI000D74B061|nr:hypothetical protein [Corynebacterium diphtheriae]AWR15431.1 hypothetical protein B11Q_00726 [Corynebacterium diphtheriae]CAB0807445.1 hypothetical protein FRC0290_00621 [Corynebacterium diphtheriae]CAB1004680.1 hypothetical protein FRC0534_00652 [Corynebacterium diphtheriae]